MHRFQGPPNKVHASMMPCTHNKMDETRTSEQTIRDQSETLIESDLLHAARVAEPGLRPVGRAARRRTQPLRVDRRRDELRRVHRPARREQGPINRCQLVTDSLDKFTAVARDVAFTRDGAVIVTADGTIQEQMVRVRNPSSTDAGRRRRRSGRLDGDETPERAGNPLREEVIWAITLSEEDGRVTTFLNGTYQDYPATRSAADGDPRRTRGPHASRPRTVLSRLSCLVCLCLVSFGVTSALLALCSHHDACETRKRRTDRRAHPDRRRRRGRGARVSRRDRRGERSGRLGGRVGRRRVV